MKIGNHRAPFLDYHKPGIFLITMNKDLPLPPFSEIVAGGYKDKPIVYVRTSPIGKIIHNHLERFDAICPNAVIWKHIVMPDHIHMLVYVKNKMELTLGEYLAKFKRIVYHDIRDAGLIPPELNRIFQIGFNDLFISKKISLTTIKDYIRNNPYRLWIRFKRPEFFRRVHDMEINGIRCSLYGNLNLLENPFKFPVIVHRKDPEEALRYKWQLWEYVIKNGGVLTGAFISQREKAVMKEIIENDGKMILISPESFGDREKPHGKYFEMCEKGNLLIISPEMPFPSTGTKLSRESCLFMNKFAELLTSGL